MRPIETQYRGVTFRSRLEARWAVFFDAVGFTWIYEQKSVPFRSGQYTPDFWLDKIGVYAEVKPCWPTALEQDKMKSATPYCRGVLLLIGSPEVKDYWLITIDGERMVLLNQDLTSSPMDDLVTECYFNMDYLVAIEKSKTYRFDGRDEDRYIIKRRYA